MLCTGLFPNADTKIQHRRSPTCPLWYDKYQLCTIWLNYVYFCMWFKYRLKAQKFQKQHALKGQKLLAQDVWGETGRMGQNLRKFCSLFIIN